METTDPSRTAGARRAGLALALFTAPWLIVAANTAHTVMTLDGVDDLTPEGDLALAAGYPVLDRWGKLAAVLGALLLVPAVLGVMRVVRVGAARLGLIGGVLTAAGYICYFAMVFQGFTADAMVRAGGSHAEQVAILQAGLDEPLTIWVYVLFVIGNMIGTFLLGLAVVRARTAPVWAGIGLMAWPVLHLVDLTGSEVLGSVLQAVGFAAIGVALLRRTTSTAPADAAPYELLRR